MDHFSFRNQSPNSSSITSSSSLSSFHSHNKGKNTNTKRSTSAGKLSTDPQSVAARERRHRISARLKILQSMVPGGSKMDTVSMLDEAIGYVKFLKAQIWFHHNMLLYYNDRETKSSCTYSPSGVGEFETVLFGRDDACVPVMESHSQGMPLKDTDSEYSPWFGSVNDHQEETMHRRGLS